MKPGRVFTGLTACSLVVGVVGWQLRPTPPARPSDPPDVVEPAPPAEGTALPLRRYPPGRVRLPADTPILGLSAGADHPAYVLKTFEDVGDHVAADVVGGRPVRVTYCDRRDCGKVFAADRDGDLRPAGYSPARGMLLVTGGHVYRQETGEAEAGGGRLDIVPSARTTWGEWSKAHPDAAVVCYPSLWQGAWVGVYPVWMADLPDDAAVVGVSVGGRHRAYRVGGFKDIATFVVRDLVGDVAVTVAYCQESGRAWAFRAVEGDDPPRLTFAGWDARPGGGLLLDMDGELYDAATGAAVGGGGGALPYPPVPVVRTNWAEWRAAHPETGIYFGTDRAGVRLPAAALDGATDPAGLIYLASAAGAGLTAVLLGRRWLRRA